MVDAGWWKQDEEEEQAGQRRQSSREEGEANSILGKNREILVMDDLDDGSG